MPIYVYEPNVSSESRQGPACCFFETLQSVHESPLSACPSCGGPIHRAVASFAIQPGQSGSSSAAADQGALSQTQTAARNAVKIANQHVCGGGCRH